MSEQRHPTMTNAELRTMMEAFAPVTRTELTQQDLDTYAHLITELQIKPIEESLSLHCGSASFIVAGRLLEMFWLIGEDRFSSGDMITSNDWSHLTD